MPQPPVIIIGMHRSGTSLIAEILEQLGLFIGRRKDENQEAFFFLGINRWLMDQSGALWYSPEPTHRLMQDEDLRTLAANYVRFLLNTPRTTSYLGWGGYLRWRGITRLPFPWGWKDPRNTYTLPLWLQLFPQAKVIHIYRNGVDIASSLRLRSEQVSQRTRRALTYWHRWNRRLHYQWRDLNPRFQVHHLTLDAGFALWEAYTREADIQIALLPPAQTRVIGYEDFLQNPVPHIQDLGDFVGIAMPHASIQAAAARINTSRSRAYENNPELLRFYEEVKNTPQMTRYGYDSLKP